MPSAVLSVNSRQYTPRTITLTPTIPAGVKSVRIALTRESWPAGNVAKISVTYPNGDPLGSVGFAGGAALKRDGTPRTESYYVIVGVDGNDLPAGQYTVEVVVSQTARSALLVERD